MYYKVNQFTFNPVSCHWGIFELFMQRFNDRVFVPDSTGMTGRITLDHSGSPDWSNIQGWLEYLYYKPEIVQLTDSEYGDENDSMGILYEILKESRDMGCSWEQAKGFLIQARDDMHYYPWWKMNLSGKELS